MGGGSLGGGSPRPPRSGKNCCRKMMLFRKSLFRPQPFPKIETNSLCLLNFHLKLSKISQPIVDFVQTCKNLTHSVETFLKNRLNAFFAIFLRNLFENFRKFSGVWRAQPSGLPARPAITLNPPTFFFLRTPLSSFPPPG